MHKMIFCCTSRGIQAVNYIFLKKRYIESIKLINSNSLYIHIYIWIIGIECCAIDE